MLATDQERSGNSMHCTAPMCERSSDVAGFRSVEWRVQQATAGGRSYQPVAQIAISLLQYKRSLHRPSKASCVILKVEAMC